MKSVPLVSVIISTHNRVSYLREAVNSVLTQTFTDFELILCDDASSDETPSLCRELEQQDSRVRTLRHEQNVGMVGNWNSGLQASRGHYFCKLDDDNRYLPTFLETTVKALETTPEAALVFVDEWFINEDGRRNVAMTKEQCRHYGRNALDVGLQADASLLAVRQTLGINGTLFVRERIAEVGGFRDFAGTGADMDLFLNLAAHGQSTYYIPERLEEYRSHEGMSTGDVLGNEEKAEAVVAIWEAHSFRGEAERLRRAKLAQAYVSLSRVLLLNCKVDAARAAVNSALRLAPSNTRTRIVAGCLTLPTALIQCGLRLRYGRHLDRVLL